MAQDAEDRQPRERIGARAERQRPVRHSAKPVHGRRTLRVLATTLIFILSFSTAGFGLGYNRLQGNIQQPNIDEFLGTARPTMPTPEPTEAYGDPAAGRALNVLVLGSDSRGGDNAALDGSGDTGGMRADTTMLAHISADRSHVDIVSIPRDTLVDIPACRLPDGTMSRPQTNAMFNSAFAIGGASGDVGAAAACAILTVEELTGIYIDDFVVVDFTGFINVVDALGGIAMYIPEDIVDPRADLELEAGCRLLDGHDALGLARARKSLGDGSDISRIGRQQDIVMKIIEEALSSRLLTDPIRLYRVLDVSTQTLTTSEGFGDIPQLIGLANALSGINSESITLVTMPFDWAGNRVAVSRSYVPYVWESLLADEPLDSAISGAGYLIAQAGVPMWSQRDPTPPPEVTAPAEEIAEPAVIEDESDAESTDAGDPEFAVSPEPPDPADSCTKENAT
ncbi:MAG TPA: LCP family protein [Actinomycetaceae bacterium]|nr:LCP family protein [Actinomycetaceae bacterium]